MALPTFDATGAYLKVGTTATSIAPAVPSGGAANKIALVFLYKENTAALTPPAGFTAVTNSPISTTNGSQLNILWKRLTGVDSGTYSFSWTGSVYAEATAMHFSGCVTSGDPTEIDNAVTTGSTAVSITPAVSGTTLDVDRLLVWATSNFSGTGAITVPTQGGTWTRRDTGSGGVCLGVATLGQAVPGATGSITGSWSQAQVVNAFLVALVPTAPPAAPYVPRRSGPNYRR